MAPLLWLRPWWRILKKALRRDLIQKMLHLQVFGSKSIEELVYMTKKLLGVELIDPLYLPMVSLFYLGQLGNLFGKRR